MIGGSEHRGIKNPNDDKKGASEPYNISTIFRKDQKIFYFPLFRIVTNGRL